MHKNYTKFNLLSLLALLIGIFFLVFLFEDTETEITFLDSGLEAAVREKIDKEEGTLVKKDVDTIQVLDASSRQIENLEGIEHLIELRELNLEDNFVKSLTPLKATTKLEDLNLRNNEITNLEDINFQDILYLNIRKLSLRHNVIRDEKGNSKRLSDISLLHQMVSLRKLDLRDNHIEDLTPISDLRRLTDLDIRENKFEDIEPLETLTRLKNLNIRDNNTKSLEPIRYLSHLIYLNIHSNNELESLEPIGELVNLETLIMRNVKLNDNYFLRNLTKLENFNAINTGIEHLDSKVIEELRKKNALQGDIRPVRMLYTLGAPVLSKESGFYKDEFKLEIENPLEDAEVYYTLDGSEPTMDSDVYTEPILIESMDNNSASVVRAKILKEDNTLSEVVTRTFFVNESINERFDLSIFSLVTNPDNLFDEAIGIYAENNYNNRGSEWERPVYIEFIESDGDVVLAQNGGVRIHGGATRSASQKSLRLYAKSEYDNQDFFNYNFFKKSPNHFFKRLIIRNSGNDWTQTMFNDALMQSLVHSIGTVDTQVYQPIALFLNGEYYGLQNVRERMDEYYISTHYGINQDELVMLENNSELYRGRNKDVYHYTNMIEYIENHGVIDDENLEFVETKMDFDNFIDYFASEIYFGNADWPGNNIMYWRKTVDSYNKDAPYGHDGRWRWMMYDTDFGFYRSDEPWGDQNQPLNYEHNTIRWVMTEYDGVRGNRRWPNFLFRELMQNEQFKTQFLVRFNDLVNSYLGEDIATTRITEMKDGIKKEMPYQVKRWGAIESMESWEEYIERKYIFAKERPAYIREYMMEEFNIDDVLTLNISNETNQGYIKLNTIDINSELPGNDTSTIWKGTYFKGLPVTIEAIAKKGYKFSHWENLDLTNQLIEITPEEDLEIQAVFIKE